MKKKPNAQQTQDDSIPYLGHKTTFQKAHPQVTYLAMTIVADPNGFGEHQSYHYSLESPPGNYCPCPNKHCKNGGFGIENFLYDLITTKQTYGESESLPCIGHINAGRHNTRRCHYGFKATVELKYVES